MADALNRIKELDAERTKLIGDARKDALERAKQAIADLSALGFNYGLSESGASSRSGRKGTRKVSDGPCPVCKFTTSPAHDARKHRGQGKRKKAFTAIELKGFGLQKG